MAVVDESMIGVASEPQTFDVERGAIVKFARAIGDPHPEYLAGTAAPPTFPITFCFQIQVPGREGIDPARVLHGEQEFAYERPLHADDRLACTGRIVSVTEKETRLGTATFITVEFEGRDERDGSPVFTGKETILVR